MTSRLLLLLVFAVTACAGEQGPVGPAGPRGEQGPLGTPGVTWTLAPDAGLLLEGATLGTQSSVLQRRVTGACGEGFAVRAVNEDGSVVCEPALDVRFGQPNIPDGSGGGSASDCMYGKVFLFAGTFAPKGTMVADGRLLSISQNTALFSLLGNLYGGDGMTTFALPNLQPLAPAGVSYVICTSGTYPSMP